MIYKVKRFSDDGGQKKSGIGTLGKVALGTTAVAGGIMAGKAGLFGNKAAMRINKAWAKAGKAIGSDKMMLSGSQGYGNASAKNLASNLAKRTNGATQLTQDQINARANKVGDRFLGGLLK